MDVTYDKTQCLRSQTKHHEPIVLVDRTQSGEVREYDDGVSPTLSRRMGTGGNNIPIVADTETPTIQAVGQYEWGDYVGTCDARDNKVATELVCYGIGNGQINEARSMVEEKSWTLNTMHDTQAVLAASESVGGTIQSVRRFTPMECERLQGLPDGWTDIGEWADAKGKKRDTSDTARYKALGNSIAIPPWKWVLKRLCANYERDATMASLFDGIGGFPYIWEQLNGKGSCLWASEIEEFPIAVTEKRISKGDV